MTLFKHLDLDTDSEGKSIFLQARFLVYLLPKDILTAITFHVLADHLLCL